MNTNKRIPIHMVIASVIFAAVMAVFCLLGYIDLKTSVLSIYLPLLAIALIIFPLKQFVFCHFFLGGAEIGLIAEYIFYLADKNHSTMNGPLANLILFIFCFILGIVLQIIVNRRKRKRKIESLGNKNRI